MPKFPLTLLKNGNNVFALNKEWTEGEGTEGDFRCNKKKIRHLVFKFFEVNFTMARIFLSDKVIN